MFVKKHIALVWELGGGLGHLARLQTLAKPLLKMGHKVTVVSRNIQSAQKVFQQSEIQILQAPLWNNQWPKNYHAISNAEILLLIGYGDTVKLNARIMEWQTLFAQLAPDLIIADYAPTALSAAKISATPTIAMGNGFEIPHKTVPVASLQPWTNIPQTKLVALEQQVLNNINPLLVAKGCAPVGEFYEMFRGDANLLCTLRELDHFAGKHDLAYQGVDDQGITGDLPKWPNASGSKVFLYLPASHFQLVLVVQAIRKLKLPSIFYIRNLSEAAKKLMQSSHIVVTDTPVNLPEMSKQADLVISHGGHGTTASTLLAGSRLLTLPTNLEQRLLSYRLSQQGLVTSSLNTKAFRAEVAISIGLGNAVVAENAKKFAEIYHAKKDTHTNESTMEIVEKHL